jgi:hypothetical protein
VVSSTENRTAVDSAASISSVARQNEPQVMAGRDVLRTSRTLAPRRPGDDKA